MGHPTEVGRSFAALRAAHTLLDADIDQIRSLVRARATRIRVVIS